MKSFFTILLSVILLTGLFFFSSNAHAQIEISPSPIEIQVHPAAFEGVAYSFITNNGEAGDFIWERNVISITEGWTSAVCDVNLCHGETVSSMEFSLGVGSTERLDVHAYPYGNPGSAIIEVIVTSVEDPEITATGLYLFNETVSVPELLIERVKMWPNPVADNLFIEQGFETDRIELYNLNGQQVLMQALNSNNVVSVAHLPTGVYVARLFDREGNQLSSNKLMID